VHQRTIVDGPHQIVVNADPVYRPLSPNVIDGFRVSSITTRTDGKPVYKNFLQYMIPQGGMYMDLEGALNDGERLAKQAIANGFPDA